MEEEHRNAIQNNFGSLVEQTDLDLMVSSLYEKGVFSEAMIEPYKDTTKDARSRKRHLYRDIVRRGPNAFGLLLEALTELGYWNLVRALDPNSSLHPHRPLNVPVYPDYRSISASKQEQQAKAVNKQEPEKQQSPPKNQFPASQFIVKIPKLQVLKSTKFHEETPDAPQYRARGRHRGVLIAFNYVEFQNNFEKYREGAEVDCANLKYLFQEMGFRPLFYNNITKQETEAALKGLTLMPELARTEVVFVVVGSHGYARRDAADTDIRCSDGQLLSTLQVVRHFNNRTFPQLRGKPKVFIFQTCRGSGDEELFVPGARGTEADGQPRAPAPPPPAPAPPPAAAPPAYARDRMLSDILIAHSTLPGFVSRRDVDKGSWYIQALCETFAARAHDAHVEDLLTLVDRRLHRDHRSQTSSVDKWGFNKRLYLHPGLFED